MKKLIFVLLALNLVGALIAGCGSSEPADADTPAEGGAADATK